MDVLDFRGIEFEPRDTEISDDDRRVLDEFNNTYLIAQGLTRGSSRKARAVIPDDELQERLAQVVNLDLMRKLLSERAWNVELGDTHIAIWRHKHRTRPSAISNLLPQLLDIYNDVSNETKKRTAVPLQARGKTAFSPVLSLGGFGFITGTFCLGMLLAAGLFIPLFLMFAADYPWIVFAWPVFGMGGRLRHIQTRIMDQTTYIQLNLDSHFTIAHRPASFLSRRNGHRPVIHRV